MQATVKYGTRTVIITDVENKESLIDTILRQGFLDKSDFAETVWVPSSQVLSVTFGLSPDEIAAQLQAQKQREDFEALRLREEQERLSLLEAKRIREEAEAVEKARLEAERIASAEQVRLDDLNRLKAEEDARAAEVERLRLEQESASASTNVSKSSGDPDVNDDGSPVTIEVSTK